MSTSLSVKLLSFNCETSSFECQQKTCELFKVQNYSHTWALIIVINECDCVSCDLGEIFSCSHVFSASFIILTRHSALFWPSLLKVIMWIISTSSAHIFKVEVKWVENMFTSSAFNEDSEGMMVRERGMRKLWASGVKCNTNKIKCIYCSPYSA